MANRKDSATRYTVNSAKTVEEVCEPLFENFNISYFSYVKFLPDNKYLYLGTDEEWLQCYFKNFDYSNKVHQEVQDAFEGKSFYSLRIGNQKSIKEPVLNAMYEHDIWNAINLYTSHESEVEKFCFASNREDVDNMNFYLNNLDVLKRFIVYFKNSCDSLIDASDESKLALVQNREPCIIGKQAPKNPNNSQLLEKTKLKKYSFNVECQPTILSAQEFQCLQYFTRGKTMKEIGIILNISHRTVESYINNIRRKIGYKSRSELATIFAKNVGPSLLKASGI
ncbi:MAG: helix-turn-helix transcriptional regulator [Alphaproteobacteria bacterium]|jgi:DNA-binding CsgD family transcriptional regulator|nr:helix-turn-helix transcriptional regulator [Alphaproteobacteria bacterium]MBT5390552.1 helix-turn-helix transcriptional regulator [Alphaproteobacteria bacterium]MBT5540327.1 helix-turn-helix transcriptional regulator [Alphaproteobacteria bacterium]